MTWLQSCNMKDTKSQATMGEAAKVEPSSSMCPLCKVAGEMNKLRLFQINLTEAVMLCTGKQCTYPMGVLPSSGIVVNRDASLATFAKKRKQPPAQSTHFQNKRSKLQPIARPSQLNNDLNIKNLKEMSFSRHLKPPRKTNNFMSYASECSSRSSLVNENENRSDLSINNTEVQHGVQDSACDIRESMYPQWCNEGLSCWLDAILCLLVHNKHLQGKASQTKLDSLVLRMMRTYSAASTRCRRASGKLNGEKQSFLEQLEKVMKCERDKLWGVLQGRLRCERGKEDSAACGLMSLLHSEPCVVQEMCSLRYNMSGSCDTCPYKQPADHVQKRVMTLSDVTEDFCMSKPSQQRQCGKCTTGAVTVHFSIQKYPRVIFSHFINGLPGKHLTEFDFTSPDGSTYSIRGVIQYLRDPDHFVTWIRDIQSGLWMECDDLKDILCSHTTPDPSFPLHQVHLVMWENQGEALNHNRSTVLEQKVCTGTAATETMATTIKSDASISTKQRQVTQVQRSSSVKPRSLPFGNAPLLKLNEVSCSDDSMKGIQTGSKEVIETGSVVLKSSSQSVSQTSTESDHKVPDPADLQDHLTSEPGQESNLHLHSTMKQAHNVPHTKTTELPNKIIQNSGNGQSVLERVRRMREKFKLENTSKLPAPKLASKALNESDSAKLRTPSDNFLLPMSECTTAKSTQMVQTSSCSRLKSVLTKPQDVQPKANTVLADSLSDRVLKYLPKGKFSSLKPFLNIEQNKSISRPTKSLQKRTACFQGYMPKLNLKKESSKSPSPKKDASVSPKKDCKTTKNVKFSVDENSMKYIELTTKTSSEGVQLQLSSPEKSSNNSGLQQSKNRLVRNSGVLFKPNSQISPGRQRLPSPGEINGQERWTGGVSGIFPIPGISPIRDLNAQINDSHPNLEVGHNNLEVGHPSMDVSQPNLNDSHSSLDLRHPSMHSKILEDGCTQANVHPALSGQCALSEDGYNAMMRECNGQSRSMEVCAQSTPKVIRTEHTAPGDVNTKTDMSVPSYSLQHEQSMFGPQAAVHSVNLAKKCDIQDKVQTENSMNGLVRDASISSLLTGVSDSTVSPPRLNRGDSGHIPMHPAFPMPQMNSQFLPGQFQPNLNFPDFNDISQVGFGSSFPMNFRHMDQTAIYRPTLSPGKLSMAQPHGMMTGPAHHTYNSASLVSQSSGADTRCLVNGMPWSHSPVRAYPSVPGYLPGMSPHTPQTQEINPFFPVLI